MQKVLALEGDAHKMPGKEEHAVTAYSHANGLIDHIAGPRRGAYPTAEGGPVLLAADVYLPKVLNNERVKIMHTIMVG